MSSTIYTILTELKQALVDADCELNIKIDICQTDIDSILNSNKGDGTVFINCQSVNALTRSSERNTAFMTPIFDIIIVSKALNSDGFPELLTDETERVFETFAGKYGQCGNILFTKYSGNYYYSKFLLTYLKD